MSFFKQNKEDKDSAVEIHFVGGHTITYYADLEKIQKMMDAFYLHSNAGTISSDEKDGNKVFVYSLDKVCFMRLVE